MHCEWVNLNFFVGSQLNGSAVIDLVYLHAVQLMWCNHDIQSNNFEVHWSNANIMRMIEPSERETYEIYFCIQFLFFLFYLLKKRKTVWLLSGPMHFNNIQFGLISLRSFFCDFRDFISFFLYLVMYRRPVNRQQFSLLNSFFKQIYLHFCTIHMISVGVKCRGRVGELASSIAPIVCHKSIRLTLKIKMEVDLWTELNRFSFNWCIMNQIILLL